MITVNGVDPIVARSIERNFVYFNPINVYKSIANKHIK